MIILVHPVVGILFFTDYAEASATAEDIGMAHDLNAIKTLKSRVFLIHLA